jgi:hypothetical protein
MAGRIVSHKDEVTRKLEMGVERNLAAASIYLVAECKEAVGVEGTGVGARGRLLYGADPAPPGQPPHKQTGQGQASIGYELARSLGKLISRVGTYTKHMAYQEMGTKRGLAARPWLRPTVMKHLATVRRILAMPIR